MDQVAEPGRYVSQKACSCTGTKGLSSQPNKTWVYALFIYHLGCLYLALTEALGACVCVCVCVCARARMRAHALPCMGTVSLLRCLSSLQARITRDSSLRLQCCTWHSVTEQSCLEGGKASQRNGI